MLIHIILAVWGSKYIEHMRDYALPTLLYPNNLVSVSLRHKCVLMFYCRAEEEEKIRQIPAFKQLEKLCEVAIEHIRPELEPNVYMAMASAHHHAAVKAKECGAHVVFYYPDAVMADGTLARAVLFAEQGKRAVMIAGPRISEEGADKFLKSRIQIANPLSPREMLKAVFPILHPQMFRYFWDSNDFSGFPSFCCWPVEKQGFLLRAFHLHTLIIDFSRIGPTDVLQNDTIDGHFMAQAVGNWPDVHIEQDSDNSGLYSITPDDAHYSSPTDASGSVEALSTAAYHSLINAFHRYVFCHAIKIHINDLDERWTKLEEQTGLLLRDVLQPPKRVGIEVDAGTKYIYDRVREFLWTISRWTQYIRKKLLG